MLVFGKSGKRQRRGLLFAENSGAAAFSSRAIPPQNPKGFAAKRPLCGEVLRLSRKTLGAERANLRRRSRRKKRRRVHAAAPLSQNPQYNPKLHSLLLFIVVKVNPQKRTHLSRPEKSVHNVLCLVGNRHSVRIQNFLLPLKAVLTLYSA